MREIDITMKGIIMKGTIMNLNIQKTGNLTEEIMEIGEEIDQRVSIILAEDKMISTIEPTSHIMKTEKETMITEVGMEVTGMNLQGITGP